MLSKIAIFTLALSFIAQAATGQETWSLQKCIEYGRQNSLSMMQAQNSIRNAELLKKQNQLSRLPNVNGSANAGFQFGRTIDPRTNQFATQEIGFNSFGINAGAILFNGGLINNSIKQSKIELDAANLDADATATDLALNIAFAYLNILLAEEQLENTRTRLRLSQEQLDQTDKLIRAGSVPANDRLDFLAQIARDEQVIIEAENLVEINYLTLKQLMEVDPAMEFRVERPSVVIPVEAAPDQYTLEEVYASALGVQPRIRANDLRLESAQLQESIAKAGMQPRLSVFGSLSTNYSSIAQTITGFQTERVPTTVFIDDNPVVIEFESSVPILAKFSYGDQIKDNFGQAVGLSLSVPIYNNHNNRIAIERARVQALNTEVINRQTRQQLKADVQNAIANSKASRRSYEAAQRSLEAAENAFQNAEKRFDLGAINSLEFTSARNTLDQAQVELTRSKYQYLFNLKIVDFYLGKQLTLD
jgi:outer membrane protein